MKSFARISIAVVVVVAPFAIFVTGIRNNAAAAQLHTRRAIALKDLGQKLSIFTQKAHRLPSESEWKGLAGKAFDEVEMMKEAYSRPEAQLSAGTTILRYRESPPGPRLGLKDDLQTLVGPGR